MNYLAMRMFYISTSVMIVLCGATALVAAEEAPSYGRDVQPLLSKKCLACHGRDREDDRVRLDDRMSALSGGAFVPGKPDMSELMRRVASADLEERMPPKGDPLSAKEIDLLRRWIAAGAPYEAHWAFQQPIELALPKVADQNWPRNPIDHFILAKLDREGMQPAPEADAATLCRRLYFDLLGLPPTPEEVQDFVRAYSLASGASAAAEAAVRGDEREKAYESLVDRLLDSPHYGERAAQHWLDVVRFAETEGFEYDRQLAGAWRFRDYVVQAFATDVPFDEFIRQQLAGDELDPTDQRLQIAVGFHRLGPTRRNAGNPEVAISRNEVLTTRTDIIGSAFLGLTIGCARCHDHKFDPITQLDYYRLQAFLAATDEYDMPLSSAEERTAWKTHTEAGNAEIKKLNAELKTADAARAGELQAQIDRLDRSLPPPLPCITSTRNREKPTPVHLLTRGEEGKPGQPVGMRLPGGFVDEAVPELPLDTPQPRTQLARWITDPSNPLTARVAVNRLWQQHFGVGLVATANDFGLHGQRPSHPELLDYLATRFVAGGWHGKPLHRLICLSSTYRQASRASDPEVARRHDPDNRLLSRYPLRRLDAESLRDAMLAVSGRINLKAGGPSVMVPVDPELVKLLYKPSQWKATADPSEHDRRSIYLVSKRNLRLPFMEAFDQPPLQSSCERRESSTHVPQALELLNGSLSNELAQAFAARLVREAGLDHHCQIERAYLLATGRLPTERESHLAVEFLADRPLSEFALTMFNLNAFLYIH